MRVEVRGQIFDTVKQCADHFGLSTDTIYCALSRGTPDNIGTGRKRPRAAGTTPFARKDPFKIGRWSWLSMRQCSKELGIPYQRFKRAFSDKSLSKETVLRRRLQLEKDITKIMSKRNEEEE